MKTPLDDIDWLTRSANRVRLLELLAERSHTRTELVEILGILSDRTVDKFAKGRCWRQPIKASVRRYTTRVTVNRLLDDLEERGWLTWVPSGALIDLEGPARGSGGSLSRTLVLVESRK